MAEIAWGHPLGLRFLFPQAWNFLCRLPILNISLSIKGCWDDQAEAQSEVPVPSSAADDRRWLQLHADREYVLQINLQRSQMGYQVHDLLRAF